VLRALAVGVLMVSLGAFPLSGQRTSNSRARIPPAIEQDIKKAIAAYAGGDDLAAERWVSHWLSPTNLAYLELVMTRDSEPWNRSKPEFLLEIAVAMSGEHGYRVPDVLKAGSSLMFGRPTAVGADPAEDQFEVLWFQAALGIAQGLEQYWLQQDLLDLIRLRFETAGEHPAVRKTRFPLARGIAAAGLCCWKRIPGEAVQYVPPSDRRPVSPDEAIALFERAAAIPALRTEALARGAVLFWKVGRNADALGWFDRVPAHDDPALGYVQHLAHGRLLDGTDRAADAASAHRAALEFEPTSQVAAIGLAAALLRLGRADEAALVGAGALHLSSETARPDAAYRRGDFRFVAGWLEDIRRLRR
jgi:hypothetical protein